MKWIKYDYQIKLMKLNFFLSSINSHGSTAKNKLGKFLYPQSCCIRILLVTNAWPLTSGLDVQVLSLEVVWMSSCPRRPYLSTWTACLEVRQMEHAECPIRYSLSPCSPCQARPPIHITKPWVPTWWTRCLTEQRSTVRLANSLTSCTHIDTAFTWCLTCIMWHSSHSIHQWIMYDLISCHL